MNKLYWLEVRRTTREGKWHWFWQIKCRNGRIKAKSYTIYPKPSLCFNDADAMAKELKMEVRICSVK